MIKRKKLKVNPLFYRDFSKWLKKEYLNFHEIGSVTRVVLNKIAEHKLTAKDTDILLSINHKDVVDAIFRNNNVSFRTKYKYFVKKDLFNRPYLMNRFIGGDNKDKIRKHLLNHFENYCKKQKVITNGKDVINYLYEEASQVPLTHIVKCIAIMDLVSHSGSRSSYYRRNLEFKPILDRMSKEDISKYLKIHTKDSYSIMSVIDMWCNYKSEGTKEYKYFDEIDTLDIIKEALGGIDFSEAEGVEELLSRLLKHLYALIKFELVSKDEVVNIIKSLNIDSEDNNWITLLLNNFKREGKV